MSEYSTISRHYFNVDAAVKVGVNAAVILEQLNWWIDKNRQNERHFHDGRYWTYNSVKSFKRSYPYMSEKAIRTAIGKLVDGGYVVEGDYNTDRYARPKWYAITAEGYELIGERCPEGQHVLPKRATRDSQKGNTLDSIYSSLSTSYESTDNVGGAQKGNSKVEPPYSEIIAYLNEKTGKHFRNVDSTRKLIHARFAEGFTFDDFKRVIDNKCARWLHDPKMSEYLRPSTLFGTKFDAYLNERCSGQQSKLDIGMASIASDWVVEKAGGGNVA